MKAQTSAEYLIILGVVLLIALGVIYLLGFFPLVGKEADITESQIYWRSTVKPINVIDIKNTGGYLCGIPNSEGYVMVLYNSAPEPIYLKSIRINNVSRTFCTYGAASPSSSIGITPGQTLKVNVITDSNCPIDAVRDFSLVFNYDTPYLSNKRQAGEKKLALKCAEPENQVPSGTCSSSNCAACTGEPSCIAAGCYWDDLNNFCIPLTPYMRCMMQGECEYCQTQQDCENSPGECYWFSQLNRCDYR
ncbi:MAG: hypothetical protein QXT25_01240 [Candidatus Anstonellaceae archaeon]